MDATSSYLNRNRLSPLEQQMMDSLSELCERLASIDGQPIDVAPGSMWARARAALEAAGRAARGEK